MIVRTWRGWAKAGRESDYIDHFHRNVIPALHHIDGFQGATLLQEKRAEEVEFLVLTRWISRDAVKAFAGADDHQAVVEPEAVRALVRYDHTVQHYEVIEETEASWQ